MILSAWGGLCIVSKTSRASPHGSGIAPYRAFWRRFFLEDVPNYKFGGLAWLFMGVANSDAKLYDDELQMLVKEYPKQVNISTHICISPAVSGCCSQPILHALFLLLFSL